MVVVKISFATFLICKDRKKIVTKLKYVCFLAQSAEKNEV